MARTFRLSEKLNLDARVDSTNAINHVTIHGWNTTVTSPEFGLPTAANAHAQSANDVAGEVLMSDDALPAGLRDRGDGDGRRAASGAERACQRQAMCLRSRSAHSW